MVDGLYTLIQNRTVKPLTIASGGTGRSHRVRMVGET
jgi:hypothetical protein